MWDLLGEINHSRSILIIFFFFTLLDFYALLDLFLLNSLI